ncbi:hypothetical protein AB0M39_21655 [Streptomyces sp. NPDC051907]|uniref:hypothetical protein n=1 Tax=Streptomyces sp. NPDC051907 TaxID=3155284 RepID=UPI003438A1DB
MTVLGSTRDVLPVHDELSADDVSVDTWTVPVDCSEREAEILAEMVAAGPEWEARLTRNAITITVFSTPRVLSAVIVPYVLPFLPVGSLWLHIGRLSGEEANRLADAAAEYEITFLNTPSADRRRIGRCLDRAVNSALPRGGTGADGGFRLEPQLCPQTGLPEPPLDWRASSSPCTAGARIEHRAAQVFVAGQETRGGGALHHSHAPP